jgi:hypothetical protein
MVFLAAVLVFVQTHVDAQDPFMVAEQDRKFFPDNVLHGGGQIDVHALHVDAREEVVGDIRHGSALDSV